MFVSLVSFFIGRHQVERLHKIWVWPYQYTLHVEDLQIKTDKDRFTMLDNTLNMQIDLKGYVEDHGNTYKPYIKKIHISERVERLNNESVGIIEITPIIDRHLNEPVVNYYEAFQYEYQYQINMFNEGTNKYIIRCQGCEKELNIKSPK